MNILLITNQLTMGGAEHFVVRLANELGRRRHHVVVVTAGGPLVELLDDRVAHVIAPAQAKSLPGMLALSTRLRELISRHGIEVIHANSPNTALAASLACWHLPVPVITSAHGSWLEHLKPYVARLFSLGSDRVVGCCEALTSDLIKHGLNERKAETIHNGIPYSPKSRDPMLRREVRHELDTPDQAPVLFMASRFSRDKGLDYLLSAMPRILERHPETRLWLAGNGEMLTKLELMCVDLGIAQRVRFLGYRKDVSRLLVAADVFTFPSLLEAMPLAVAEAMAAGLPVVATPAGGVPEIVRDGQTGYLVPMRDPAAMAAAVLRLLDDPARAQAMGLAGQAHVEAHFTLQQMVSKFERLYGEQVRTQPTGFLQRAFLG